MHFNNESLFFLQAIIIIGIPYAFWYIRVIRKIFPIVVLQILVGVLLGPSVLAKVNPHIFQFLFPEQSLAFINGISWIAVTFFGFLTGLHFDISELKGRGKTFVITGISSLLVPFMLVIVVIFLFPELYPMLAGANATPLVLYIAMGIVVSVTALPVLAAILIEMQLIKQQIGKEVLSYASVNDGVLWILVSILFILSSGSTYNGGDIVWRLVFVVFYFLFMFFAVRPLFKMLVRKNIWTGHPTNLELVMISVATLISALVGELIGIHYFLGAFLIGTMIPKEIASSLYAKKEPLIFAVLLPFFFVLTGLKTMFDFTSFQMWAMLLTITAASVIGKFIGTVVPSVTIGKSKLKHAVLLAVFMQCKGLMEIVVLTIIFQAGIINAAAFSGLIIMSLVITAMTKPLALLMQKVNKETSSQINQLAD